VRNLDEQMDLFNPRSSNFEPIEPLPKNPITGEPELAEPFDPELLAKAKRDVQKAPIDIAEGAITAPITAAGDIVDLGAMLPDPTPEQALISPTYAAIEETFDILSRAGISRDNAVKLINENTPINLEGNVGEFVGEAVGVTATGVAKAATGLAKIASKYGDEAGKYLSEIGDELGDMFRAATPGGDDFDGMAPATVSTGTTIKTSTDFERPSVFRIFGGTQGRTANTRIKKAEEAEKVDSDPEYVFKESSVFRGEDKKIRYEIATKDVELLPYFKKQGKVDDHPEIKDDKGNVVQEQMYQVFEDPSMKTKTVLADVIKFDELFKEYPHLKGMQVRRLGDEATQDGTRAMYDPFDGVIFVSDLEEEEFISSLLHEIQHAVDHFEGRQYGASPTMFRTDAMREATSKLDQLSGERNNFFHFITNKETSENFEKYTPDELDTLRSNEFQLLMSSVYSDRYINDEAFDHLRKEFNPIIAKFADWEKRDFQELVQLRNEYDILEKQASIDEKEAFRKYRSAGGEVDARNVQIRRSKPETQLNVLPSETADMPKDLDLVDKFGKPVSLPEKSPLRVLFDELPETERAMLPPQPDANRLYGYHGTASARGADEPFFDINFARTNDQFLGEGFYFTLDPEIASEYASIRGIGTVSNTPETRVTPKDLRFLVADTNVKPEYRRNVDSKKRDAFGNPVPTGTLYKTPEGQYYSMSGLQKGEDIYGEPIAKGQSISRFDLSNLKKPYVVRTEKQRKELKAKIPELKEQGYDSVLFADFKDRSKQIMVFPEHMDKIDTSSIAGRSANVATEAVDETVDTMTAAGVTADDVAAWRKTNETSEEFRKSLKGRSETLKALAAGVKDGVVTRAEYREAADAIRPIRNVQDVPRPATAKEIVSALGGREGGRGILGLNRNIPDGAEIDARLDINAYTNFDVWIPTLKHEGKTLYSPSVSLKDVTFIQPDSPPVGKALKVATGAEKAPFAVMKGKYNQMSDDAAFEYAQQIFDSDEWIQVGYDPTRRGYFYDRADGAPVLSAEEVVQIGHLVLAKKAQKGNPEDFAFNKGGVVPMDRQMDMFADGGLEQDGGTNDPVSGNEVPPGSTQEEVRDDIPAQLSEGEFVFPADVVRFIGLNKLMQMRQEAKMGLKMMEEMGQMGNSEEATMPDNLPFDINDLDMDDEPEYNVGGFVPGTQQDQQMGIAGYQAAPMPTTSYATQPVQAASQQFVQPVTRPAQAYVPTQQVPTPMPTFGEITGPGVPEVDFEFATFRNEAGQEIQLRIKKGSQGELLPGEVLPEGYSWVDPTATATEEVTTTPTTVETTTVREESDGDEERQRREEEMYGPGGGRVGVDGKIYGVSFDMPEGFMPGMGASISTALSLATGEPLPEGVTVNFKRGQVEFSMTSEEYNDFKSTARKFGYNSKEASKKLNELGREEAEKEAKIAEQIEKARRVEDNMARAAQKIKDEKEREAALLEVAKRREDRSVYGTGGDDTGTKGQGYSVGSQTDKGSGATDRGFGGTGRGRSDAPGMAAADVRSGSNYGTSPPKGPMGSISGRPRAKGGLMESPKPKPKKKMKRGGLASKK